MGEFDDLIPKPGAGPAQSVAAPNTEFADLIPNKGQQDVPAFPAQAAEEEEQQREAQTGQGLKGAGLAAGIVGGEALPAALGAIRGAKIAAKLKEINAAQDAAHIQKLSDILSPRSWDQIGPKITKFLKEDAQSELDRPVGEGEVPWQKPGAIPRAPQDLTEADLKAANPALESGAKQAAIKMLKNPWFWTAATGTAGGSAYGVYHAARTLQWLNKLLGE